MAITCITFDLDDTLWEAGSVLAHAERRFYEWLAQTCTDIADAYPGDALIAHRETFYASVPEISHDLTRMRKLWLTSLMTEWGYAPRLAEIGFQVFWERRNAVTLFDNATEVLRRLGHQYVIGAITNGNADVHHIGIGHYFDFVVTPVEAGAAKPESAIFAFALNAAGAAPEATVHVGDHPINDVVGAAASGIRTVWVNPAGHAWPEEVRPDAEIRSLDALIAVIDGWH